MLGNDSTNINYKHLSAWSFQAYITVRQLVYYILYFMYYSLLPGIIT